MDQKTYVQNSLFPIISRVGIYGIVLTIILYLQSQIFDATELVSIVFFTAIITIFEIFFTRINRKVNILWYLLSLIILISLMGFLINESMRVRESWYRIHVLEDRIQNIVYSAPTAIIVSDGLGNIKDVNSEAEKIVGWKKDELLGKSLSVLMRPEKFALHKPALEKEAQNLKLGSTKWIYVGDKVFRIVKKDGGLVRVAIYILGVRFSSDKESGMYVPGKDIEFYAIIRPVEQNLEDLEYIFVP